MFRLINFKTQRQAVEWHDERLDKRLRIILYALAGYVFDKFQKFLVITEIFRTSDEQKEIYKGQPKMAGVVSVHEVWRGADVRTHNFTSAEVMDLLGFLNDNFEYDGKSTAIDHDVQGYHIHIQVDSDGVTKIRTKASA
jgi:hypothetical protein